MSTDKQVEMVFRKTNTTKDLKVAILVLVGGLVKRILGKVIICILLGSSIHPTVLTLGGTGSAAGGRLRWVLWTSAVSRLARRELGRICGARGGRGG